MGLACLDYARTRALYILNVRLKTGTQKFCSELSQFNVTKLGQGEARVNLFPACNLGLGDRNSETEFKLMLDSVPENIDAITFVYPAEYTFDSQFSLRPPVTDWHNTRVGVGKISWNTYCFEAFEDAEVCRFAIKTREHAGLDTIAKLYPACEASEYLIFPGGEHPGLECSKMRIRLTE